MSQQKPWFKLKDYGWGWQPASREGWACIAVYAVVVISAAMFFAPESNGTLTGEEFVPFMVVFVAASAALYLLAYKHAGRPKWRWKGK